MGLMGTFHNSFVVVYQTFVLIFLFDRATICQRAMERSVLGVRLSDRVRNTFIHSKAGITENAGVMT